MRLKNCTLENFMNEIKNRNIFCFGASRMPEELSEEYPECHLEERIRYFCDNDAGKWNTYFRMASKDILIVSPEKLASAMRNEDILLITSGHYKAIYEQLQRISALDHIDCYIWPAIAPQYKTDPYLADKLKLHERSIEVIPKTIHYFWFGGKELPPLEQKCVDSWKRVCPDYEIIRWDESNYDISCNQYMMEAYQEKKWGFVPDYARLDVVYRYGGIYLDTDVEVLRPLDDLLKLDGFAGFESKWLIALGLGFGARPGHPMIREFARSYENRHFILENGTLDMTASPLIQTELLKQQGFVCNNQLQMINDMVFLPAECLSPDYHLIPHVTDNTYIIFPGHGHRERIFRN